MIDGLPARTVRQFPADRLPPKRPQTATRDGARRSPRTHARPIPAAPRLSKPVRSGSGTPGEWPPSSEKPPDHAPGGGRRPRLEDPTGEAGSRGAAEPDLQPEVRPVRVPAMHRRGVRRMGRREDRGGFLREAEGGDSPPSSHPKERLAPNLPGRQTGASLGLLGHGREGGGPSSKSSDARSGNRPPETPGILRWPRGPTVGDGGARRVVQNRWVRARSTRGGVTSICQRSAFSSPLCCRSPCTICNSIARIVIDLRST